jgi:hypothetical protein
MNDTKYIGLDVHQATISVAVLDSAGKLVMEAILETKAETILQFIHGLRGRLRVTLEEGTCFFKLITLGRNQLAASDDVERTWIAIPQWSDSNLSIRTTTPTNVEFNGLSGWKSVVT